MLLYDDACMIIFLNLTLQVATGVEMFSGEKLDIWSCGVSLYNFTTGLLYYSSWEYFVVRLSYSQENLPQYDVVLVINF